MKTHCGAHDRNRTDEPLPYQGSALPTELRGLKCSRIRKFLIEGRYKVQKEILERETRLELATFSLEG
jgi:hypothetical protein